MKVLPRDFEVEALPAAEREAERQKRLIECKFDQQCQQIKDIVIRRERIALNPLYDAIRIAGIKTL